jgi:glycosyltransferase involved in cell wall biosynthesis
VSRIHPGGSFDPGAYFDGKVEASPHPRPYILSVGRIEARKNIPLLARAFVHAGLPDIDLVIVGKRDLGYSAALPENDRIVVREEVDDRQLVALYRHASLFVFPSEAEGFGLPLLDAVLFGLPTIASNRTSLPEVGGDLATYFDPTGPAAVGTLATMIGGHFTDRPIPSPSPEGRAAHAGKYNWERAAHELTDALDRWQLQTAATLKGAT